MLWLSLGTALATVLALSAVLAKIVLGHELPVATGAFCDGAGSGSRIAGLGQFVTKETLWQGG